MIIQNCPVIKEANQILDQEQAMVRTLRHFKNTLRICSKCENDGSCEALNSLHQSIDIAIREVGEEWGF